MLGKKKKKKNQPRAMRLNYVLLIVLSISAIVLLVRRLSRPSEGVRTFTPEELWQYRGENNSPVYIAVKGRVYDVSSGRQHYGPGGSYSGFAGRDASRSFTDLCFTPECLKVAHIVDERWDAKKEDRDAVEHWAKFYEEEKDASGNKKYPFVGILVRKDE